MNEDIEITPDMSTGKDEVWCEWFKCPNCEVANITRGFDYCPNCGKKLIHIKVKHET